MLIFSFDISFCHIRDQKFQLILLPLFKFKPGHISSSTAIQKGDRVIRKGEGLDRLSISAGREDAWILWHQADTLTKSKPNRIGRSGNEGTITTLFVPQPKATTPDRGKNYF